MPWFELAHTLLVRFGAGTPIMGAIPPGLTSVAPSGMVPPMSGDGGIREFASEEEVPGPVVVDEALVQLLSGSVIPPPPSNEELMLELLVTSENPELLVELAEPQEGDTMGLSPPGSISVAPSGIFDPMMPVGSPVLDPPGPSVPSGEVAPMPEVTKAFWAYMGSQPNRIVNAIMKAPRMALSGLVDDHQ
jgi:hypothetical protein